VTAGHEGRRVEEAPIHVTDEKKGSRMSGYPFRSVLADPRYFVVQAIQSSKSIVKKPDRALPFTKLPKTIQWVTGYA
jgi:hypothetical protein